MAKTFSRQTDQKLIDAKGLETPGRDESVSEASPTMKDTTEVTPRKAKRRFPAKEKLRILSAADGCVKHGELGALLRLEGIYSTQLGKWRRLRDQGELGALTDKKRGRKPCTNPLAAKLAETERRLESMTKKLEKAEEIIDVQKKIAELFGRMTTLPTLLEKT